MRAKNTWQCQPTHDTNVAFGMWLPHVPCTFTVIESVNEVVCVYGRAFKRRKKQDTGQRG